MINKKDIFKLMSVMILTVATVFICSIFVNFYFDLNKVAQLVTDSQIKAIYDAQLTMSGIIVACTGGVLGSVTLIVLGFSINKFIADNRANMGVLKALGYGNKRLALSYAKFGYCVGIGSVLGYFLGFLFSPFFYKSLIGDTPNKFSFGFNIQTVLFVVIIPTVLFTLFSIVFAGKKLKDRPLELINGKEKLKKPRRNIDKHFKNGNSFLNEMKRITFRNNRLLMFFVAFAGFGFSAQIQMAFSMRDVTPDNTMTVTLIIVGTILGLVTLLLAFSYIFNSNKKNLAVMKTYGYTEAECNNAIFGGYRIASYLGFIIGTAYQFMLVKVIISIFASSYEIPDIKFNFIGLLITLTVYTSFYEILMLSYKNLIAKTPFNYTMNG